MAENSKIEWTHHTFNPWSGCTKVSAGCANCYAAVNYSVKMRGVQWGPNGNRIIKADSGWSEPIKWARDAEAAGERRRVFCASLADVFEGPDTMPAEAWPAVEAARARLFDLIHLTPSLDWLLLTKRPENIMGTIFRAYDGGGVVLGGRPMLNDWWRHRKPPANVWLGTSVENQEAADKRIPELLKCPAAVRFLSCEPLLGVVDLTSIVHDGWQMNPLNGTGIDIADGDIPQSCNTVHWVIVGGESGPKARPMNVEWVRSIVQQCKAAGVACFVKQLGAKPVVTTYDFDKPFGHRYEQVSVKDELTDPKGGDPSEWPEDLRVREFPR